MPALRLGLLACCIGLAAAMAGAARAEVLRQGSQSLDLSQAFGTKSDWRVSVYGDAGDPDTGSDVASDAKVCFARNAEPAICTPLNDLTTPPNPRPFQRVTELSIEPLSADQPKARALMLRFQGAYPTGWVDQTAVWTYDRRRDRFRLASALATSDQGEERVISSGPMAGYLITADLVTEGGETRLDTHRYYIRVYRYDGGTYGLVLNYVTAAIYLSETTTAIESELPTLPERLKAVRR